jgi:hypothetical protein
MFVKARLLCGSFLELSFSHQRTPVIFPPLSSNRGLAGCSQRFSATTEVQ